MLIQRDLVHAQHGLHMNPELALLVTDEENKHDGYYHQIYLNYGKYMLGEYKGTNNIFVTPACLKNTDVLSGAFTITGTSDTEMKANKAHIGSCILAQYQKDSYLPGTLETKTVTGTNIMDGTFRTSFVFDGAAPAYASYKFAPSTSYRLVQLINPSSGITYGMLRRNKANLLGGEFYGGDREPSDPAPMLPDGAIASVPNINIEAFRLRCLFVDSDKTTLRWIPAFKDFTAMPAADLRYVEITIDYTILDPDYKVIDPTSTEWHDRAGTITRLMRVSPRLTVLNSYD